MKEEIIQKIRDKIEEVVKNECEQKTRFCPDGVNYCHRKIYSEEEHDAWSSGYISGFEKSIDIINKNLAPKE